MKRIILLGILLVLGAIGMACNEAAADPSGGAVATPTRTPRNTNENTNMNINANMDMNSNMNANMLPTPTVQPPSR
jgi:hypothetical protein